MHIAMFISGSVGLLFALSSLRKNQNSSGEDSINRSFLSRLIARLKSKLFQYIAWVIGVTVLVPTVTGAIMASILNHNNYLLLDQEQCSASFVNSRLGYLNIYIHEWTVKLEQWLGLNI